MIQNGEITVDLNKTESKTPAEIARYTELLKECSWSYMAAGFAIHSKNYVEARYQLEKWMSVGKEAVALKPDHPLDKNLEELATIYLPEEGDTVDDVLEWRIAADERQARKSFV